MGVKNTCSATGVDNAFSCARLCARQSGLSGRRHVDGLQQRRQLVAERRAVVADAIASGRGDDDGRNAIDAVLPGLLLVEHEVQHLERDVGILRDDLLEHPARGGARLAPDRLLEENDPYRRL